MAKKRKHNDTKNTSTNKKSKDEEPEQAYSGLEFAEKQEEIHEKFKVQMPKDFFEFWKFCQSLNPDNPSDALLESLGMQLVGPFDVLAGNFASYKGSLSPVLHWRYFYDPPEFMTLIKGDDHTQYHLGYYRDEPSKMPIFVAANSAKEGHSITPQGDNLFAAIRMQIDQTRKSTKDKIKKKLLEEIGEALRKWAEELGLPLEVTTRRIKERNKKVVAKTFHGAGIVVPVVNDVGYRPLPESNASLKKILDNIANSKTDEERIKNFDPLQEIITLVQFANDECDYGEGYELGIDLFCYGSPILHKVTLTLLPMAYALLERAEYGHVIEQHLANRERDNLSVLD